MMLNRQDGLLGKLKQWVTGEVFEEDYYAPMDYDDYEDAGHTPAPEMYEAPKRRSGLKVVEHPRAAANHSMEVIIVEPKSFDESLELIEHLRERRSVILNLQLLDTHQSQRVVDFLSGATHAVVGHQQRIGDGVFLFTPSHVAISTPGLGKSTAYDTVMPMPAAPETTSARYMFR